jgi:hypothetical protein
MPSSELKGSAELRHLLAAHRPARNSDGYPESVRRQAVAWSCPLREAGHGWTTLSQAIGVSRHTLRIWCTAASTSVAAGPWLPVTMADGPAIEERRPVLVTPSGFRVENLDAASLLRILRELA